MRNLQHFTGLNLNDEKKAKATMGHNFVLVKQS